MLDPEIDNLIFRPHLERIKSMSTHVEHQVAPNQSVVADILRIVLAVLLPPVGVLLQVGLGMHFWLNIVLTLCGYIPGLVHAIWVIARK